MREGRAREGDAQRSSTRPRYLRDGQSSKSASSFCSLEHRKRERERDAPWPPQTMHLPPYVPKLHSSQMRTSSAGRTYESQIGLSVRAESSRRRRERKGRGQLGALRRELGGGRGRGRTTCRRTFRTCGRWLFRVEDEDEEREEGCVSSRARGGPRREEGAARECAPMPGSAGRCEWVSERVSEDAKERERDGRFLHMTRSELCFEAMLSGSVEVCRSQRWVCSCG